MISPHHVSPSPRWLSGHLSAVALATLLPLSDATAQQGDNNPDLSAPESQYKDLDVVPPEEPWREGAVRLPSFPRENDLLAIRDLESDGYRVYLDRATLTESTDGVLRYTVVIVTRSGAANMFYEGVRCSSRELKTYAFATRAGAFRSLPSPPWVELWRLPKTGVNSVRRHLGSSYLCDRDGYPRTVDSIERISRGLYPIDRFHFNLHSE